jgi:undecaprenyl diphosphate synthase
VEHNQSSHSGVIRHLGLIPDGARRWAESNQVSLDTAYIKTMEMLARYVDLFFSAGVSSLSIYLASSDNIEGRQSDESTSFISAEHALVSDLLPPVARRWSCRVSIVGKLSPVTSDFRMAVEKFAQTQEGITERFLYLLIDYDPSAELQDTLKTGNTEPLSLSQLCVPEYVDGIIRTGLEQRLSNFLPLQSGYAELYFLPKLFLDTSDEDLLQAYQDLLRRSRRLGK